MGLLLGCLKESLGCDYGLTDEDSDCGGDVVDAVTDDVTIICKDTNQYVTAKRNNLTLKTTNDPTVFAAERDDGNICFASKESRGVYVAGKTRRLKLVHGANQGERTFELYDSPVTGKRLIQHVSSRKFVYNKNGFRAGLALSSDERNALDFEVVQC